MTGMTTMWVKFNVNKRQQQRQFMTHLTPVRLSTNLTVSMVTLQLYDCSSLLVFMCEFFCVCSMQQHFSVFHCKLCFIHCHLYLGASHPYFLFTWSHHIFVVSTDSEIDWLPDVVIFLLTVTHLFYLGLPKGSCRFETPYFGYFCINWSISSCITEILAHSTGFMMVCF